MFYIVHCGHVFLVALRQVKHIIWFNYKSIQSLSRLTANRYLAVYLSLNYTV